MIEIVNRQRKIKFDAKTFQAFAERAASSVSETEGRGFTLGFVSDRKMRGLNRFFRGNSKTTDVLSFPYEPDEFEPDGQNLGDIVISVERAERQARENNLDFETEIKQLILHGVLHLCGYDHETDAGEMNARELKLRKILGI